jgi:hypothetical protein
MHPILASRKRLLLYLATWIPVDALLVAILASVRMRASDAATILGPAFFLYAFVCLSPWYICRARPFAVSEIPGFVGLWLGAAAAGGGILAGGAWLAAQALGRPLAGALPLIYGFGVLLYLVSAAVHYAALAAEASRHAERRAAEARTLAREAELQVLKLQINPHFLFNSLNSIAALATQDGGRAREMCIRLAEFLRGGLGLGNRESIPLREELELAKRYLDVERVRFGGRVRVEEQIESACEQCAVPALLLQPLVENAVKHGVAGLLEGAAIRLEARREGSAVAITLENEFDPESAAPHKMGMGLENVRRRLAVRYGREADFTAGPAGGIYRVVLRLPCDPSIASSNRA